jgi:hypothetical protein
LRGHCRDTGEQAYCLLIEDDEGFMDTELILAKNPIGFPYLRVRPVDDFNSRLEIWRTVVTDKQWTDPCRTNLEPE